MTLSQERAIKKNYYYYLRGDRQMSNAVSYMRIGIYVPNVTGTNAVAFGRDSECTGKTYSDQELAIIKIKRQPFYATIKAKEAFAKIDK